MAQKRHEMLENCKNLCVAHDGMVGLESRQGQSGKGYVQQALGIHR